MQVQYLAGRGGFSQSETAMSVRPLPAQPQSTSLWAISEVRVGISQAPGWTPV